MDYGDESRQMPPKPVVKKKHTFLKLACVAIVAVIGFNIYQHKDEIIDKWKTVQTIFDDAIPQDTINQQIRVNFVAKDILVKEYGYSSNLSLPVTYICSSDISNQAYMYIKITEQGQSYLFGLKLTFEEDVEDNYKSIADAIETKKFIPELLMNEKMYDTVIGDKLICNVITNGGDTKIAGYVNQGYQFKTDMVTISKSYDSDYLTDRIITYTYTLYVEAKKDKKIEYMQVQYTTKIKRDVDYLNVDQFNFNEGEIRIFKNDIFESQRIADTEANCRQGEIVGYHSSDTEAEEYEEIDYDRVIDLSDGNWIVTKNDEFII